MMSGRYDTLGGGRRRPGRRRWGGGLGGQSKTESEHLSRLRSRERTMEGGETISHYIVLGWMGR